ncbi:MAG: peptidoglycan recognition family protein [Eubacteriales bacterium]|nr:peptidoglycan recognition family protein [Eubacteriales bacterium]
MSNKNKIPVRPARERRSYAVKTPKKNRNRVRQRNLRVLAVCLAFLLLLLLTGISVVLKERRNREQETRQSAEDVEEPLDESLSASQERWQQEGAPYIDVQLLTPNSYSRPQIAIEKVNYIAIHYTANPGSGAQANRDYFENLAVTQETKVSSHFVVGLDGEVIQCIPTSEMSYATNSRNVDSVSIECCHMDETGVFSDATYDSVVKLTAWLCTRFELTEDAVIRHYDVTGKDCPKYYVEHPDAWEQMKADIAAQIQQDYALQEKI